MQKIFKEVVLLDIISNMKKRNLADIVAINFELAGRGLKKGKSAIRVEVNIPGLDTKNVKPKSISAELKKSPSIDIQSVLSNILISAIIQEEKAKKTVKDDNPEIDIIEERQDEPSGGYGTSRRSSYTSGISASYKDYGNIFSYLGALRAKGSFEELSSAERISRIMDDGNKFFFLDSEVIDAGMKQLKYFSTFQKLTGEINAVPMGGINSKDWEMLKMWKQIDPVMYSLKMSTM